MLPAHTHAHIRTHRATHDKDGSEQRLADTKRSTKRTTKKKDSNTICAKTATSWPQLYACVCVSVEKLTTLLEKRRH